MQVLVRRSKRPELMEAALLLTFPVMVVCYDTKLCKINTHDSSWYTLAQGGVLAQVMTDFKTQMVVKTGRLLLSNTVLQLQLCFASLQLCISASLQLFSSALHLFSSSALASALHLQFWHQPCIFSPALQHLHLYIY